MKYSRLESYLTALERELQSLATGERAEILLEIKSHIEEKLDSDNNLTLEQVIVDLGSPKEVAMRYISDRGMEYKPAETGWASAFVGIFKWSVIGFLGTIGIGSILAVVVLFSFSPLVQVDEEKGTVKILGGMIDISEDGKDDLNIRFNQPKESKRELVRAIENLEKLSSIEILAHDGKLDIENSEGNMLRVECKARNKISNDFVKQANNKLEINLKALGAANCELEVPKQKMIELSMNSGLLKLDELKNPLNIDIHSGRVKWRPAENTEYRYRFEAVAAKIDSFASSNAKNAYEVNMKITSGKITRW